MKQTDIIFIRVLDNKNKIWRLCECITTHFHQGDRIQIAVHGQEAAKYVDDLLWRLPEESFLPHHITQNTSQERISITLGHDNLNKASILFNLHPAAHPQIELYSTIYEFYDETHPSKTALSEQRLKAYPYSRFLP